MHPLPPPVHLSTSWPASRQLLVDGAGAGACLGAMGGIGADLVAGEGHGVWAGTGLAAGAVLGLVLGLAVRSRHTIVVDSDGVHVGRIAGTVHVAWAEVAAVGRREDWHGRSGRVVGLAVCRRGDLLPMGVPALTFTASPWRMGRGHPVDRLAAHRDEVLQPIRPWAEAMGVPVVEEDLDLWWDQVSSAEARCQRR